MRSIRWLCCFVPLLAASLSLAQTPEGNLEKYRHYKARLHSQFLYYTGDASIQASHLPMELRRTDAEGRITAYWADGTWWQGHYVAVLATEYARLRRSHDTLAADSTLEELRQALKVYDRLDWSAEACWNGDAALNGFYLRDDVPLEMAGIFGADIVRSDYQRRCGDTLSVSNGPSQDQAWAAYLAMALVLRLVDGAEAADVRTHAAEVVRRMVEGMQYTDEKGKGHWQVKNPVNGLLVQKEGDIQWLKYAHAKAYEALTGQVADFAKATDAASRSTFKIIQNNFLIDKHGHFNWYGVMALSTVINAKGRQGDCTYDWLVDRTQAIAKKRPDLQQPILFPHFPLISLLLYPQQPSKMLPASLYEDMLNAAPAEGAYRLTKAGEVSQSPAPWHTLSLFCPWHNTDEGEYNMLDYMLLYNLYRLVYP